MIPAAALALVLLAAPPVKPANPAPQFEGLWPWERTPEYRIEGTACKTLFDSGTLGVLVIPRGSFLQVERIAGPESVSLLLCTRKNKKIQPHARLTLRGLATDALTVGATLDVPTMTLRALLPDGILALHAEGAPFQFVPYNDSADRARKKQLDEADEARLQLLRRSRNDAARGH